ncbi:MAG: ribose-phosphate pyrophosphokinase-like domain-containing protein, partial [Chloroflexi bacterium]|nr:ribose-phosphate pyrophosphokinase-like domain-containing protein [Chloroflexota bacterium]
MSKKQNNECGMYGDIKLFAGTATTELTEKIAEYLSVKLSKQVVQHFPNDTLWVRLKSSIRGQDVYIVQTTS